MANLLGGKAAVRTIIDWRRGRYKPPLWAIDVLQDVLRSRAKFRPPDIANFRD
jgi:hypothetical protein